MMDRQHSILVWQKHNTEDSLFRHALSVEAAMRYFAQKYGEDPEYWGLVGLLHDVDYQEHPTEHLKHAREMLEPEGYGQAFIRAVESHGWGLCTDVEPVHKMEKVLFAVDELTGLIAACAFVRPSRSVLDMEVKSVKKKWGSAAFAAGVSREVILKGAGMLEVSLEELIAETIEALRKVAADVGLKGTL